MILAGWLAAALAGCVGGFAGARGEKVNDDVTARQLTHGHEQGDRRACGDAREFKVAGDGLSNRFATDDAAAGQQGDERHQQLQILSFGALEPYSA